MGDQLPPRPVGDLQAIGLSLAEERAYELLIERPPATMDALAVDWDRDEPLDGVLATLETKGLVRRLEDSPALYLAAPPDIAVEALLHDNEQQLQRARGHTDQLVAEYPARNLEHEAGAIVEVVVGDRAVRQRLAEIQRSARHQIRCLDKAPHLEVLAQDVACRIIHEGHSEPVRAGWQSRIRPELPIALQLIDDRFAVVPAQTVSDLLDAVMIIRPSLLLDGLADLFESLWRRALPPGVPAAEAASARPAATATDREALTALILAGLTDQAIARKLGVGHRTAQRRIAALLDDLGVRTRFQAGVQTALGEEGPSSAV